MAPPPFFSLVIEKCRAISEAGGGAGEEEGPVVCVLFYT